MEHTLSRLHGWELDHKEDDIRGWPLRSAAGKELGTVSDLVFDSETGKTTEIVLDDGRRYRAHDVWLGERITVLVAMDVDPARTVEPPPAHAESRTTPRVEQRSSLWERFCSAIGFGGDSRRRR